MNCKIITIWLMGMLTTLLAAQENPLTKLAGHENLTIVPGRPTDRSVAMNVIFASAVEGRVEYGVMTGEFREKTEPKTFKANEPQEIELKLLKPNTRYYYRMMIRPMGKGDFQVEREGSFQTQRAAGSTFTFALQGDSHPERAGKMFDSELYLRTMRQVAKEPPDFYLLMGDDFSIERLIERGTISQESVDQAYALQRQYLDVIGRSSAVFLVNGNHEQAAKCNLTNNPNNPAALAGLARTRFYSLPAPDSFYGGDREQITGVGLVRDYYSWTWGDALFVVIDPYWHSPVCVDNEPGKKGGGKGEGKGGGKKRDLWQVTLGEVQYRWLSKTLLESKAKWKFVFSHHVLGTGRGGIECAPLFEWGGKDKNGRNLFAEKRPGWGLPVHDLMVKAGVTIFFQGHDHLYARQDLDGIIYQSVPIPADPTYQAFNRDAYRSGDVLPNSGHLRVTVSPQNVQVDYVRSYLPKDATTAHPDGEVAKSYKISAKYEVSL